MSILKTLNRQGKRSRTAWSSALGAVQSIFRNQPEMRGRFHHLLTAGTMSEPLASCESADAQVASSRREPKKPTWRGARAIAAVSDRVGGAGGE